MNTIEIQKGNIYTAALTFTDKSVTPNIPYDLTGKTIKFTVKKPDDFRDDDDEAIITKDWSTHTNPSQGLSNLDLTAIQTNKSLGNYKYDFKIDGISTVVGDCIIGRIITTR